MGKTPIYILVILLYCKSTHSQISTFSNPIVDVVTRHGVILQSGGSYYLVYAINQVHELEILKSSLLTDFRNAEKSIVYRLPPGYTAFYPSKIFEHQNNLYIYFAMATQDVSWRMFVVNAHDPTNPMGMWSAPTRLLNGIWNNTAAHGTPFQFMDQLYFVWSGTSDTNPKWCLYIAKMRSPTEISEPVIPLRETDEQLNFGFGGPSFLYNREKVFMVITTSDQNTTTMSSLSMISIKLGVDPMIPTNWEVEAISVFNGSEDENVYGIRYSDFTTSPDGTETWMTYTVSSNVSDIGASSRIRIEKIDWNKTDGSPIFPAVRANGYQHQLPSGEQSKFHNPIPGALVTTYPNAHRVGSTYYAVSLTDSNRGLLLLKSDKLYDFSQAEESVVYSVTENLTIANGRIFEIGGEFYLYFSTHSANEGYWLYVTKADNSLDLLQSWGTPIRLLEGLLNGQGFHPSVLQHNDQLYLIWTNPSDDGVWKIYIAPMHTPSQVDEPVVLLKEPKETWECFSKCELQYPSIVYRSNAAFMVFGESVAAHPSASLSYMGIENGRDPLDITNWYTSPGPVFNRNDAEDVYAVSRAYLTTSPDGQEDWMMYMASSNASNVGESRSIRLQKIDWQRESGHPIFPKARGLSYAHAIPRSFEYFANPITDETSESPNVIRVGNFYYMILATDGSSGLELLKSGKLENFRNAERKIVYSVPDNHSITASPKLHKFNNKLYIYFSMEAQNGTSKLYVLQAQDPGNPMGLWDVTPTLLAPSWNLPAFHSSLLELDENFYLVWVTPNPASGFNSIYIGKMENATHVLEPINLIRHPTELWECDGGCSNQAPHFIYNDNEGTAYMVHSVGAMCKHGNALTFMSIDKGKDPLNSVNWNKAPGKIFAENLDESIFCPAHATFTKSPDGKEIWMVYHATNSPHVDAVKTAHIEKIVWEIDTGEPVFPDPHGMHHEQLVPGRKVE